MDSLNPNRTGALRKDTHHKKFLPGTTCNPKTTKIVEINVDHIVYFLMEDGHFRAVVTSGDRFNVIMEDAEEWGLLGMPYHQEP